MRTRTCITLIVSSLLAIACGSTSPDAAGGPLRIGIIAGNRQAAKAAPAQLPVGVTSQLVRLPNGQIALRQAPAARVGGFLADLLLPTVAHAQTTLVGSPVPGNVVCASPASASNPLTPVVLCANTDAQGMVTFVFTHGTKAGEALAVVKGMVGGEAVTLDTARATILPEAVATFGGWPFSRDTAVTAGQVLNLNGFPLTARDRYSNVVTNYVLAYQRFNTNPALNDAARIVSNLLTVRAGDTLFYVFADTAQSGGIHVRVVP
jgi:hypothetical protein